MEGESVTKSLVNTLIYMLGRDSYSVLTERQSVNMLFSYLAKL